MSTSYSVFKQKFKKTIADAIYNEVTSKTATYYHWFGKENAWTDFLSPFIGSSTGDYPGQPSDNFRYELHVRRDILTAKKIKTSDVSYVVPRYDWTYNTVYDMYDDSYSSTLDGGKNYVGYYGAVRLEDAKFYVMTSDYNVYKCLNNNNNSKSTIMPTGTSTTVFTTSDGYKWKFLYTLPVSLRNKFLSSTYMPVATALSSNFYSNGNINKIVIESGGQGYNPGTTTAIITGDGSLEDNPYLLSGLTIIDAGSGYTGTITLTVSPPFSSTIDWSSQLDVPVGSYIKYNYLGYDNFYYVVTGTKLGTLAPTHLEGTINNGSCQLKYIGTTATAGATRTGDHVDTVSLNSAGFGYQGDPAATVTVSAPVTKDADWTASTLMIADKVIKSGTYYYRVSSVRSDALTGTSAPNHTTGAQWNNNAEFTFIAKDAIVTPTQVKTNAEITLTITPGITSVYTNVITNHGTKYTEVPSVTFAAPASGVTATGVIESLSNNGVYIIKMTEVGSGYAVSGIPTAPIVTIGAPFKTFNGATSVDAVEDKITYNGHKLVTGDAVVYTNGGGTSVGGLTSGNTYYVIKLDDNNIQLANSAINAAAGTFLGLTDGVGASHKLTLTIGAATANAILGTGGEIVGYSIVEGKAGAGYTNANIQINDTSGSGSGGILTADFGVGNVNTLQANVELLAIPGTIEAIKVVNAGTGYGSATVSILGDGTGATAEALCSGGKVVAVNVTNPGRDYTWTDVQITGTAGNDGLATARAIMSPLGGHGSNAIDELNANSLAFYTSISRDKNQGIEINNDYRKVGLVRNFKKHGQNTRFTDDIGSGCVLITAQCNIALLQHDMLLLKDGYKKYRIVDFVAVEGTNDVQILLSVFNNFTVDIGDLLVTDPRIQQPDGSYLPGTVTTQNIIVTSVSERTIDQFSGDFLMFSVREPYSPTADQIITVRTVLTV
jgi:hypothetical protein